MALQRRRTRQLCLRRESIPRPCHTPKTLSRLATPRSNAYSIGTVPLRCEYFLSTSNHHPETWTPWWTVLLLVNAFCLHMITTANEIRGVVTLGEQRRWYAGGSSEWQIPWVVDHGRMVAAGIFPLSRENYLIDCDDEKAVDPLETSVKEGKSDTLQHPLPVQSQSGLHDATIKAKGNMLQSPTKESNYYNRKQNCCCSRHNKRCQILELTSC